MDEWLMVIPVKEDLSIEDVESINAWMLQYYKGHGIRYMTKGSQYQVQLSWERSPSCGQRCGTHGIEA